ncbi:hypothetical protein OG535_29145 [Kitasatospora sp. NBC_00085]|uniref:hypothetical protein n=1 Tax=Kitasatospora sp. NBC_00085 TaxID=2903566 RepID=UPI0032443F82
MNPQRTPSRWPDRLSQVPEPSFAGPGWRHAHGNTWVYQDVPEAARVHATLLADGNWHLDLWSAQNRLLARGPAPAGAVGALAPALTANATRWAPPSGIEASQRRFTETAEAVRDRTRLTPDEARARAATVPSPASARSTRSPTTAAPPPGALPAPPGALRPGR